MPHSSALSPTAAASPAGIPRPTAGAPASPRLRTALVFAAWAIPAALAIAEGYLFAIIEKHPIAFWRVAVTEATGWYIWAAITPFIFYLVRRRPLRRPFEVRTVVWYVGTFVVCIVVHAVAYGTVARYAEPSPMQRPVLLYYGQEMLGWLPVTVLVYWTMVGVGHWLDYAHRERERELHTAALTAQLAQAQLATLRMQLHPHFLFNTLNTIAMLVREQDADTAVRLISQLGDVLRQVLRSADAHEVPLQDEIAFVRQYLAIEQVRFEDRLRVEWRIDETVLDAAVPNLILQPLVENALRHGIARRSEAGRLAIAATRQDGRLTLVVSDDGPGPDQSLTLPSGARASGLGLANTRARLAQLYGAQASLELIPGADGGTVAMIALPFHRSAPAAATV